MTRRSQSDKSLDNQDVIHAMELRSRNVLFRSSNTPRPEKMKQRSKATNSMTKNIETFQNEYKQDVPLEISQLQNVDIRRSSSMSRSFVTTQQELYNSQKFVYSQKTTEFMLEKHNHSVEKSCSEMCPVFQEKKLTNAISYKLSAEQSPLEVQSKHDVLTSTKIQSISPICNHFSDESDADNQSFNRLYPRRALTEKGFYLSLLKSGKKEMSGSDLISEDEGSFNSNNVNFTEINSKEHACDAFSDDENDSHLFTGRNKLRHGNTKSTMNYFSCIVTWLYSFIMYMMLTEARLHNWVNLYCKSRLFCLSFFLIPLAVFFGVFYWCDHTVVSWSGLPDRSHIALLWNTLNVWNFTQPKVQVFSESTKSQVLKEDVGNQFSSLQPKIDFNELSGYIDEAVQSKCRKYDVQPNLQQLEFSIDKFKTELNEIKIQLHESVTSNTAHTSQMPLTSDLESMVKKLELKTELLQREIILLQQNSRTAETSMPSDISDNKLQIENLALKIDTFLSEFYTWQAKTNLAMSSCVDENIVEKIVTSNVKDYFMTMVTNAPDTEVSFATFKTWLSNSFVTGDQHSSDLAKLKQSLLIELQKVDLDGEPPIPNEGITKVQLERALQAAIMKYDADKLGLADYALESAGGTILSTRCTENYKEKNAVLTIMRIPIMTLTKNARTVIQPSVYPGECWAFKGYEGFVVIQLCATIIVESFTMEHIPRSLAPDGTIKSAPKEFSVIGLVSESDLDGHEYGRYTYDEWGSSFQNFPVQNHTSEPFNIIELRIHSNYGNLEYTCLYRFRVHGKIHQS